MVYSKSPTTIEEQIDQLIERGMSIADREEAKHFLGNISYYRLAGYWWPMQSDKEDHTFKPNSSFDDVISLYNFDRELRILLFDVIERIEIGLRTRLIYHMSHNHSPWWLEDVSLFNDSIAHIKSLYSIHEEIERSKETFMKAHKNKYKDDGRLPPALRGARTCDHLIMSHKHIKYSFFVKIPKTLGFWNYTCFQTCVRNIPNNSPLRR